MWVGEKHSEWRICKYQFLWEKQAPSVCSWNGAETSEAVYDLANERAEKNDIEELPLLRRLPLRGS